MSPEFYIFVFSGIRGALETFASQTEYRGEFFFAKFWFLSFLFASDLYLSRKFKIFSPQIFFFPVAIFSISPFVDRYFFFREFDNGMGFQSFIRSILSFFVLSNGIPKLSLIMFFAVRAFLIVYLVFSRKFNFIVPYTFWFLISYLLWHLFHLQVLYGKLSPLFFVGFEPKTVFIISGYIYFLLLSLIYFRKWIEGFIVSEVKNLSIFYIFLIAMLGYISGEFGVLSKIVIPFTAVLGFRMVEILVWRTREKILSHKYNLNLFEVIELSFLVSLFGASRGIFTMFLPFVVLFMFFYYVPPLELGKGIWGAFLSSAFFFLMCIISHLSLKNSFFITSEGILVGTACAIFAFFENLSRKFEGLRRKIFAFATSVSPLIFMHSPEDIGVALIFGIASFRFDSSAIPRIISAIYFVSKFYYLKYMQYQV
ncbi:MAG: hypothetical protein NZ927_08245 [Candidatus Calescibacterium sp.]|nr:hypothetical protein [Candidatus Calescibacterium sp.]MCX7734931.1 hypothetical protein [bacterium]